MTEEAYLGKIGERVTFCLLGVFGGLAGAALINSLKIPFLMPAQPAFLLVIGALVGCLISLFILEFRKAKEFRENSKIRNETVALITHEMRTALTSTGWAIHLVLDGYGDKISESDKRTLKGVITSIDTTVMHSVNLLDVSLLDIGKLAISLEWVTLAKVETTFNEIVEKFTYGAKQKGITLTSESHLDYGRQVEVDMLRLRIVLENLLENSLQYTLGDKKEIRITINNDAKSLNISVSDTGIGIPLAEQEKIFSEFFRASNARRKLSSGSGIGLYMSKRYIHAHHGTFRFESKENEGTTFYISIPLKSAANVNQFLEKI